MSMSDARLFAELTQRVAALESRLQELADRVEGKDVHNEVLGRVPGPEALTEDRAARDGLRTLLERGGVTVAADPNVPLGGAPEGAGGDPGPEPALQGAEAVAKRADSRDAHHDARRAPEPKKA